MSEVDRQIERSRWRLARLRERARGEAEGSPLREAVEELEQTLEELSISVDELASANEELRESQEAAEVNARRYLDLFRSAPDAYVVTDDRGAIVEVNQLAEQKLGRPGRYLVGKPLLVLVAAEDREAFRECLSALGQRRARLEDLEIRFGTEPGFDASVSAVPEACAGGLEIRWTLRDVTERRRAEQRVRESEARIRAVVDAAQDGIIQIDQDGTILMANAAACRAFGYEARELLGRNVSILTPSPHRERHAAYLERYLRTGEARMIGVGRELEGVRRDGSRLPIHLSVGVVQGARPSFVGVLRDLSLEKSLRSQLRAAATAASLAEERERRRLAADLHDDVSQLLTLTSIKLGLLSEAPGASALDTALRELRELVARAHQHTESLSFQLSPPILHDVGLAAAAEWLAEDLERLYGLKVHVESDGEPALGNVERMTLFRAFRELLINVARHAETDAARLTLSRADQMLRVTVEDAGVGFVPDRERGGFGLLSVRERVAAIGGCFELDTEAGRGTCARITLPLSAPAPG